MSIVSEVNGFIVDNNALVVSAAIPVFAIFLGLWGGFLSHRAKVREVNLVGRAKLSEYRQKNFEALITDISALDAVIGAVVFERVLAFQHEKEYQISNAALSDILTKSQSIMLRIRSDTGMIDHFRNAISLCLDELCQPEDGNETGTVSDLSEICRKIANSEWKQIEAELKGKA
ncbi:hypothetical protein [Cochlodiniinecator piscidefendens]|uniref:hypothetical protein n=1 Tax=Cochlodiniinecator piscidefendens TaxID=2715756 RepID=UPI001409DE1D|nr:hypothetical protein [Cochlodiniinecator piscidefendens]